MIARSRRRFLADLGLGAAAVPFAAGLCAGAPSAERKRRLVVMFSPNGVVPWNFWSDANPGGKLAFKESLKPLEPFADRTLLLKGISNRLKGDGDRHMRGIGCLLTGIELFPGNIQGGSDTPAGWASGLSIDQEIRHELQKREATRTRFGSLEFGVMVPERADTWTRMVYAGANRPIAPIDNPYRMFKKLYGGMKDRAALRSVLDDVRDDLSRLKGKVGSEDRGLLEDHETFVRGMERRLADDAKRPQGPPPPDLPQGVADENDNMPRITRIQIDLLVHSFRSDFARLATLQFTNSVGQCRMNWLGIRESHHSLSHMPDKDGASQEKLTRINGWFAGEVAYLAKRLAETPEPGGEGSLLDNTLVIWTNELGKGNSHTLDNIPFVLIGGGLDFKMGRVMTSKNVPHHRLLLALAHGFGHELKTFGNPDYCGDGPLTGLA